MAYNPPIGSIYHLYITYILPSGGLYATYHLLGEPETTIEFLRNKLELQFFNMKKHSWRLEVLELISVFFRQFMCYILSSVYSSVIFPCVFLSFYLKAYLGNG